LLCCSLGRAAVILTSVMSQPSVRRSYSKEQLEIIQRVLTYYSARKYYELFDVHREASTEEINKKFKKLVLQLHPDKNPAPRAEEAFNAAKQAKDCLLDPTRRAQYDTTGVDQAVKREPQLDPFEEFFVHTYGPRFRVYRTNFTRPQTQNTSATESTLIMLLQILPLLLMFILAFTWSPHTEEQLFSFERATPYVVERFTKHWKVSYFVKRNFEQTHGTNSESLRKVENLVERQWVRYVNTQCHYEQQHRQRLFDKARWTFDRALREQYLTQAKEYPTPSCSILEQLEVAS